MTENKWSIYFYLPLTITHQDKLIQVYVEFLYDFYGKIYYSNQKVLNCIFAKDFWLIFCTEIHVYLDQLYMVSDDERQVEVDRPLIFSHFWSATALPFRKLEVWNFGELLVGS
jgi:hypothetical protein